jgi:hypothetical protein
MIEDRIKNYFDGTLVEEGDEYYLYYYDSTLRLSQFIDKNSAQSTIFSLFSIISWGQVVFSDGFVINPDFETNSERDFGLTFDEIGPILYAISGNLFQDSGDLVRSWRHNNTILSKEYDLEYLRVSSLFSEAGIVFSNFGVL